MSTTDKQFENLLAKIETREKTSRRNAVLWTLLPVFAAVVLLTYSYLQIQSASERVGALRQEESQLREEIKKLEAQKWEAEASFKSAVEELNAQGETAITRSIEPKASATRVSEVKDPQGRSLYDFRVWIIVPESLRGRIAKVVYEFDHPTFFNKIRESAEPSNGFAVGYRGWGCLYRVRIDIVLKDGSRQKRYFDMCSALG